MARAKVFGTVVCMLINIFLIQFSDHVYLLPKLLPWPVPRNATLNIMEGTNFTFQCKLDKIEDTIWQALEQLEISYLWQVRLNQSSDETELIWKTSFNKNGVIQHSAEAMYKNKLLSSKTSVSSLLESSFISLLNVDKNDRTLTHSASHIELRCEVHYKYIDPGNVDPVVLQYNDRRDIVVADRFKADPTSLKNIYAKPILYPPNSPPNIKVRPGHTHTFTVVYDFKTPASEVVGMTLTWKTSCLHTPTVVWAVNYVYDEKRSPPWTILADNVLAVSKERVQGSATTYKTMMHTHSLTFVDIVRDPQFKEPDINRIDVCCHVLLDKINPKRTVYADSTNFSLYIVGIDECDSMPCLNDGTCTDESNGYVCQCASGYTGITCDVGYVFTEVLFLMDEIFRMVYFNTTHKESIKLVKNIETLLNAALGPEIEGFQSANVTFLRNVKKSIGVDFYVVSLLPVETFEASSTRAAVENALIHVLSSGFLGSYLVRFAGPKDIQVKESRMALSPSKFVSKYVFTKVSIRSEKEFQMKYVETNSAESFALTTWMVSELKQKLESGLKGFQSLEVLIIRLEDGNTMIDLEVVSVATGDYIDVTNVRQSIKAIVNGNVFREIKKNSSLVHSPSIEIMPPKKSHVITRVSLRLETEFIMTYTDMTSNETLDLKSRVEDELGQPWLDANDYQFALVTLLRDENGETVVDMNIDLVTTEDLFDKSIVKRDIQASMLKSIEDYDMGGYPVDITATIHPLTVDTPLLGILPPIQAFAFTRAALQLQEPWNKVYNHPRHTLTEQLIFGVEGEMKNVFDLRTKDHEVEVTGLSEKNKNVSVDFNIATLTIVDKFNITLIEETLIDMITEVTKNGDIGGYSVSTEVPMSFKLFQTQLGPPKKDAKAHDQGFVTPGTPAWILTMIIAASCVAGTIFLVGIMCTTVRAREKFIHKDGSKTANMDDRSGKTTFSQMRRSRKRSSSGSED